MSNGHVIHCTVPCSFCQYIYIYLIHIYIFDSIMSHLFSIHYTGSQLEKKGLISNYLHFALNLWNVLPLPTSQIFFTFTLLLGSSVLLQTPECSEYPSFAQSQVVSALSITKLQQHGTNSLLLSVMHPLSVPSSLPWKPYYFQSPCPEVLVCVKVCVCVRVCASVGAYVCSLRILIFDVQMYIYVC